MLDAHNMCTSSESGEGNQFERVLLRIKLYVSTRVSTRVKSPLCISLGPNHIEIFLFPLFFSFLHNHKQYLSNDGNEFVLTLTRFPFLEAHPCLMVLLPIWDYSGQFPLTLHTNCCGCYRLRSKVSATYCLGLVLRSPPKRQL